MSGARRAWWVWPALLATLAAAFWPEPSEDLAVTRKAGGPARRPVSAAVQSSGLDGLGAIVPGRLAAEPGDLFPKQNWLPPPVSAPAEEKPTVPPLPFRYGGRYEENGQTTLFLMEGDRVHSVKPGSIINGTYRVDRIEKTTLALTYLPLSTEQSMVIDGMSR